MPEGTAVMERPIDSPVERTDMSVLPPQTLEHPDADANAFTDEAGAAPVPDAPGLLDGPERTLDDLKAMVSEMKRGVSGSENPKKATQDYTPVKPVGKIRMFLKRHPVLAPIMAPLAGLAALMLLIARSASKSTKERQGQ